MLLLYLVMVVPTFKLHRVERDEVRCNIDAARQEKHAILLPEVG
jgi:hypothetical protein